jgi:hypothetical protein
LQFLLVKACTQRNKKRWKRQRKEIKNLALLPSEMAEVLVSHWCQDTL